MSIKNTLLLCLLGCLLSNVAQAQFWFGPKIGFQRTTHSYQDESYSGDFVIDSDINYNIGMAMEYSTNGMFEIHSELVYMQVNNKVATKLGATVPAFSESSYKFLSAPLLMRAVFGNAPFNFYVNFGPRLTYWLGGSGSYFSDEFSDFSSEPRDYKIRFDEGTQALLSQGDLFFVPNANRLQYAFDVGAGMLLGINQTQRIMIDFRYSFGHSNMAFNRGTDLGQLFDYDENLEYTHQMVMFSVAYLFGYDVQAKKKGRSTSQIGNK